MNLSVAINVLTAILGPHIVGAIVFSPHEEKGKEAIMPEVPLIVGQAHQTSMHQRAQIIRVSDFSTNSPIKDAAVRVRMSRSSTIIFKQGHTNAQGLFVFTYDKARELSPISVCVDAPGYWGVDAKTWLTDQTEIPLLRMPETVRDQSRREKIQRMPIRPSGRLLVWPT